jgi:hypothetical protein
MSLISSADVMGSAAIKSYQVAQKIVKLRDQNPPDTLVLLDEQIDEAIDVVAKLCVARYGVKTLMPSFTEEELTTRTKRLEFEINLALRAIRS